jgi:hypothetical protein
MIHISQVKLKQDCIMTMHDRQISPETETRDCMYRKSRAWSAERIRSVSQTRRARKHGNTGNGRKKKGPARARGLGIV